MNALKSILVLMLSASSLGAAQRTVTLAWDASPDYWVIGYGVYYGAASGVYTNRVDVGNSLHATIGSLVSGTTYYFTAVSYTTGGLESVWSNETSYTVPRSNRPKILMSVVNDHAVSIKIKGEPLEYYTLERADSGLDFYPYIGVQMDANGIFELFEVPDQAHASVFYRVVAP